MSWFDRCESGWRRMCGLYFESKKENGKEGIKGSQCGVNDHESTVNRRGLMSDDFDF